MNTRRDQRPNAGTHVNAMGADSGVALPVWCERCSRSPVDRRPPLLGEIEAPGPVYSGPTGYPTAEVATIRVLTVDRPRGRFKAAGGVSHTPQVTTRPARRTATGFVIGPCSACEASPTVTPAAAAHGYNAARQNGWPHLLVMRRGELRGPDGEKIAPPILQSPVTPI